MFLFSPKSFNIAINIKEFEIENIQKIATTTVDRACSSDGGKTKILLYSGWKAGWKETMGRPRRRWEDNIRQDLREVGVRDENWLAIAQGPG